MSQPGAVDQVIQEPRKELVRFLEPNEHIVIEFDPMAASYPPVKKTKRKPKQKEVANV